jgi:membrane-associated protease RseP (regulator of RpoE activity)
MITLFLLVLLGTMTYFIVQRVAGVTRTPWWLLWLVAMAPAFIWTGWSLVMGEKPMPTPLVIIPFVVCLLLYWFLVQWGRLSPPSAVKPSPSPQAAGTEVQEPRAESTPPRPINQIEERSLQNCFPWSVYYLQNFEYRAQAVICRGQLKSKPEVAYQTVRENVEEKFGDRFYVVFQEDPNGKPVFVLVPNPHAQSGSGTVPASGDRQRPARPAEERLTRPLLAASLLLATLLTTAFSWQEIAKHPSNSLVENFQTGLPYALTLIGVLGVHELAHYLTARRYKIQATLPYFIPILPLPQFPFGTFGAFIQIRAPIPHRRALFDVGISGPLAGFVIALPLLLWGLAHSDVVPLPQKVEPFNFLALKPHFSLLLTLASKLALGSALTPETAIKFHPVAVASCLGIVVTAFNLMPVGQLDGGHIVHAMFGQRTGAAIGQIARLLLLMLSFFQPHLLLWALILFLISANDEPALNDVTELDNSRDFWGLVALGLLLLIILPAPTLLSRWLGVA